MKKAALFLFLSVTVASCGYFIYSLFSHLEKLKSNTRPIIRYAANRENQSQMLLDKNISKKGRYEVYSDGLLVNQYEEFDEAVAYASTLNRAGIKEHNGTKFIWDNYPPYRVFLGNVMYVEFESFASAEDFARQQNQAYIYYRKNNSLLWQTGDELPTAHIIPDVPLILQNPELPRGCEVTSLNMLLAYNGISVDKMDLAREIKRDETPYEERGGSIYYGNPYAGFVGDMYDINKNGFGVYHGPIHELLTSYMPYSALDLTGCEFDNILGFIAKGMPVWVIINTGYQALPKEYFVTWHTPQGPVEITMREHSILLTGYDEDYIYYNDPLDRTNKADRQSFEDCWIQMGRQAVTCTP